MTYWSAAGSGRRRHPRRLLGTAGDLVDHASRPCTATPWPSCTARGVDAARRAGRAGPRAGLALPARAARPRPGSDRSSCTRGSRAATTAPGGTRGRARPARGARRGARVVKGELVGGAAVRRRAARRWRSSGFEVVAAALRALVAFNARELASVTGDGALADAADAIAVGAGRAVGPGARPSGPTRWSSGPSPDARWPGADGRGPAARPGRRPTTSRSTSAFAAARRSGRLRRALRPDGRAPATSRRFDPGTYWRGPAWPQLTYLLWLAARRRGHRGARPRCATSCGPGRGGRASPSTGIPTRPRPAARRRSRGPRWPRWSTEPAAPRRAA